ncbi:lymphotoxin-alpha-like isoform X2 [Corticium candelabrum]|uniref:lymphotoxin-alpha-like isoform X2 n=1 Tax=Corticium candelabrum TaxID=121492 RepID=UPI002E258FE9|nr:lymphotoxin-alpha-like isoform X2 [Corticium candelabrum]XP_062513692.1 lymphotoxin-alpha-like isoform X2 [Corticium candelabrum]
MRETCSYYQFYISLVSLTVDALLWKWWDFVEVVTFQPSYQQQNASLACTCSKGEKGEKGIAGTMGQGRDGDKGMKGDKGENGIVGLQGAKGDRGETGERGEKGRRGESLRVADIEETITTLIDNKLAALNSSLWRKTEQLSEEIPSQGLSGMGSGMKLTEDFERPAAHLVGNRSSGHYSPGVITQWYTKKHFCRVTLSSRWNEVKKRYITVPQSGLYYVYAQLYYGHRGVSYRNAGYSIRTTGNRHREAEVFYYSQHINDHNTHYTGRIFSLNKGDRLLLHFDTYCYYYFSTSRSFFGAFKL